LNLGRYGLHYWSDLKFKSLKFPESELVRAESLWGRLRNVWTNEDKSRVIWPYGEIVKILVFSKGCVKVKI